MGGKKERRQTWEVSWEGTKERKMNVNKIRRWEVRSKERKKRNLRRKPWVDLRWRKLFRAGEEAEKVRGRELKKGWQMMTQMQLRADIYLWCFYNMWTCGLVLQNGLGLWYEGVISRLAYQANRPFFWACDWPLKQNRPKKMAWALHWPGNN